MSSALHRKKNHHHHLDFLLCCLIGISWFYGLHFGLCFIFEQVFVKVIKSVIDSLFLHVDIQLWPHYIEETIFAPLYCLCSPVENLFACIHTVLHWTRYFSICLCVCSPAPHCLDECSFRVSLEVGQCQSSSFAGPSSTWWWLCWVHLHFLTQPYSLFLSNFFFFLNFFWCGLLLKSVLNLSNTTSFCPFLI